MATPTSPTRMPTTTIRGSRSPKKIRPRTAIQTGRSAIWNAATPAGTVRSPRATRPMPPSRRAPPTIAESRTWRPVGRNDGSLGLGRLAAPFAAPEPPDRDVFPDQEGRAGEQEPDAGHEERRDGLIGQADADVGRAPHEVDDEEPEPDRDRAGRGADPAIGAGDGTWLSWLVQVRSIHRTPAAARGSSREDRWRPGRSGGDGHRPALAAGVIAGRDPGRRRLEEHAVADR